jgi:hypothetical protein
MDKGERMTAQHVREFLTIGEGAISPATRIAQGEIVEERVSQLEADVQTDRFYRHLPEGVIVPTECVDGRLGPWHLGPNAAGGSFTVAMGFALTDGQLREGNEPAPKHAARVFRFLMEHGQSVGGHVDMHAHGPNCGCGAQDKLDSQDPSQPSILRYIEQRSNDVRGVIEALGVEVSDETHAKVTMRSAQLRREHYATTGADIRQAYLDVAGEDSISTLVGDHKEVLTVINTQEGTTLDRSVMAQEYNDDYQVFNVDVWAIKKTFDSMALNPEEAHESFVAALYYNVATAAVLADSSMGVVVR